MMSMTLKIVRPLEQPPCVIELPGSMGRSKGLMLEVHRLIVFGVKIKSQVRRQRDQAQVSEHISKATSRQVVTRWRRYKTLLETRYVNIVFPVVNMSVMVQLCVILYSSFAVRVNAA